LDEADGWIHLVNICEAHACSTVVLNTAARNVAVRRYGQLLDSSLEALGADLQVWWVIQGDGLELLREFMEVMPQAHVHVIATVISAQSTS
jgi:hypothetical protein